MYNKSLIGIVKKKKKKKEHSSEGNQGNGIRVSSEMRTTDSGQVAGGSRWVPLDQGQGYSGCASNLDVIWGAMESHRRFRMGT
jgi:hypothetical protein